MKALVVIDVQKALFEKKQKIHNESPLLQNINRLIEEADAAGASVYVVQHCNDSFLKKASPGWQIHEALKLPRNPVRILKRRGSCFDGTNLEELLRTNGEAELVITGLGTRGCVRASCLDGLARGYTIILAADGHSNYDRRAKEVIDEWNEKIAKAGAVVLATKRITFD
jgi:nicotinamidase-related amidase